MRCETDYSGYGEFEVKYAPLENNWSDCAPLGKSKKRRREALALVR